MTYKKLLDESLFEHLKNRRVWAALLSAFAAGALSLGYPEVAMIAGMVAGACSMDSYVRPKQ